MKTMATLTLLASLAPALHAVTNTLEFTSLPSAQGWAYSGRVEQRDFSVSGSSLTQNTIGIGYDPSYYQLEDTILSKLPFSISMRARLLDEELGFDSLGFGVQVSFTSGQGDDLLGIGLSQGGVVVSAPGGLLFSSGSAVDTSQFHEYVLTGKPVEGQWELFVDGDLIGSGITGLGAGLVATRNIVYLGDLTDASNARAELTRLIIGSEPPPQLAIRKVEPAHVQLSWATNTAPYDLEFTDGIPASFWSPVTNAVTVVGGEFFVTVDADAPARFFRLRQR